MPTYWFDEMDCHFSLDYRTWNIKNKKIKEIFFLFQTLLRNKKTVHHQENKQRDTIFNISATNLMNIKKNKIKVIFVPYLNRYNSLKVLHAWRNQCCKVLPKSTKSDTNSPSPNTLCLVFTSLSLFSPE